MSVNKKSKTAKVLIVGAGPTGLTLAIELALLGVSFRIIDKSAKESISSKAISIQSKTMERLFGLGLIAELLKLGKTTAGISGFSGAEKLFSLMLQDKNLSPLAFTLTVPQSTLESILIAKLKDLGYKVERETELESFSDTADGVKVLLSSKKKQEESEFPFMVACDGANSTIRRLLDVRFEGNSNAEEYFMADGTLDWESKPNHNYLFLNEGKMLTLQAYNDTEYRVMICRKGDDGDKITPLSQQEIEAQLNYFIPDNIIFKDMTWSSAFKIKRKYALKMKIGNIFLAGDAAHVHNPLCSQGLNTGMQDATNLAWKLGYYINGVSNEKLLESYEEERLPVAKDMYTATNLMLDILLCKDQKMVRLRNHILPMLASRPWIRSKIVNLFSEISCNYRSSPVITGSETIKDRLVSWGRNKLNGGLFAGDRYRDLVLMYPDTFKRIHLFELVSTNRHLMLSFVGDDPKKMTDCIELQQRIISMFPGFLDGILLVGQHAVDYNHFGAHLPNAFLDVNGQGHKVYGCEDAGVYLIRPDGYIEFISVPGNEEDLIDHIKKFYPGYAKCEKYIRPDGQPFAKVGNGET